MSATLLVTYPKRGRRPSELVLALSIIATSYSFGPRSSNPEIGVSGLPLVLRIDCDHTLHPLICACSRCCAGLWGTECDPTPVTILQHRAHLPTSTQFPASG
jgi:hypothetical protein